MSLFYLAGLANIT